MLARQEVEQPGQAQRLLVLRVVVLLVVSPHLVQRQVWAQILVPSLV